MPITVTGDVAHLATEHSSYVIELAGSVRLLHWDDAVADDDLAMLSAHPPRPTGLASASLAPSGHTEIVGYGGLDLRSPSFAAEFADGTRSVDLAVAGHRVSGDELIVELTDRVYPLSVQLHYRVRADCDVIERWLVARNTGETDDISLRSCLSADVALPEAGTRVSYLHGAWGGETRLDAVPLPSGRFELDGRGGYTSHRARPWFALDDGHATETAGAVWSASLAWTGSWRLAVERGGDGALHAGIGMHDLDFDYRLSPGESLQTPRVALLYSAAGFGDSSRRWHDYARRHLLRKLPPRPVLYNSWEATAFDVSLDGQTELARRAARIGVELFVVDDGWFVGRTSDHAGLGDWRPDQQKLPGGLDPLISRVRELGMSFGLWVEPEMVNADSELYREHPDWVYHFPTRPRSERRHQLVLNLARDDVADFVYSTLDGLLRAHDISFIKWDFNRPIADAGWPDEPHGNPQRLWVGHVENLYSILERLRAAYPDVLIEACAGGGGRIDLGMIGRTDQVWISDNTDPYDRVELQYGYSQAYPPETMVSWVTDEVSHINGRSSSLEYRFHVSMAGVLGIGADLTGWTEQDFTTAAGLVAQYKDWREIIQHGRQYRIGTVPATDGVRAVQYVADDGARSIIFLYAHGRSFGENSVRVMPAGLDPDRSYRCNGGCFSGRLLAAHGIDLPVRGDTASTAVTLD